MTLAEFRVMVSLDSVRRIAESETTYLWEGDFYDGARSGMLEWGGRKYWFEIFAENADEGQKWYRRFAVLELTEELMKRELEVQADFERYVLAGEGVRETMNRFYDKHGQYCLTPRFEACKVVAWFEQ